MAVVKIYNTDGAATGELTVSDNLFGATIRPELVHEAVVAQEANSRDAIAHTKTRGEVRGGGRKPWKQKGTGRARHGSRRSPIWIGGGITFGPRSIRNFSKKINKKMKRKALSMVLTDKLNHDRLIVVESFGLTEGKTKELNAVLTKLPSAGKKVVLIDLPENKQVAKAAKNVSRVETLPSNSLNVVDLLKATYVVATKEALSAIEKTYQT